MDKQYAHVCHFTLELHLGVDLNVLQVLNVLKIELVLTKNVLILVQELVVKMLTVKL